MTIMPEINLNLLRAATEPGLDSREVALTLLEHGRSLPVVRSKPCHDCAVVHGLYTAIAACGYRHLNEAERRQLADGWDCHNGGRCEGAAAVLDAARATLPLHLECPKDSRDD